MLIPKTFEGFCDLCTKVYDMEIHLNKQKKEVQEGGRARHSLTAAVAPKKRAPYAIESSSPKESQSGKIWKS